MQRKRIHQQWLELLVDVSALIMSLLKDRGFGSLSLVSHEMFEVTNICRSKLIVSYKVTIDFIPDLVKRFPNIRSLKINRYLRDVDHLLLTGTKIITPT